MKDKQALIKKSSDILYPKYRRRHINVGGAIDESKSDAEKIIQFCLDEVLEVIDGVSNCYSERSTFKQRVKQALIAKLGGEGEKQ